MVYGYNNNNVLTYVCHTVVFDLNGLLLNKKNAVTYIPAPNINSPAYAPKPLIYLGASSAGNRYAPYTCARLPSAFTNANEMALVSGSRGPMETEAYDSARGFAVQIILLIKTRKTYRGMYA